MDQGLCRVSYNTPLIELILVTKGQRKAKSNGERMESCDLLASSTCIQGTTQGANENTLCTVNNKNQTTCFPVSQTTKT